MSRWVNLPIFKIFILEINFSCRPDFSGRPRPEKSGRQNSGISCPDRLPGEKFRSLLLLIPSLPKNRVDVSGKKVLS
ncbi:MAG: hypothetical protein GDA48_28720 [Hormoscilla sp. GM102CHS1]|nr:hypothetical protein [Hormoscilla sp. GM102CHS1]